MSNRYNNPNSKRKAKARAKREAKEMCQHMAIYPEQALTGTYAMTPDEFVREEKREKRGRVEPESYSVKRRERKFKEPKQYSATGRTKQHIAAA